MKSPMTRRSFLRTVAVAGAAFSVWPRRAQSASPNAKLSVACVGVGGMGWGDLHSVASHPQVNIAALCDVDAERLARAAKGFPDARRYADWRELLDKEDKNVDALTVTIPDHMHAPVTMSAILKGKHVYCQKPLAHDIHEVRQVTLAARKAGVVTQMGIQFSSGLGDRMTVAMLQGGAVGKVKEVYLWSNKPTEKYRPTGPRPQGQDPVPETLKWDSWLGTAPVRPYVQGVYHPTWWRGWQDFGVGWLGDMGCHITSAAFAGLKLTAPLRVRAEVEPEWAQAPARRSETWPTWQRLSYTYPGNELAAGKTLQVTWSDGYKYPPDPLRESFGNQDWPKEGALFLGEEGALLLPHGGGPQLFPAEKFKGYERPKLAPLNHYHAWVNACRGEGKTGANFDYAGPLTEAVLLGTVALRCPGHWLQWNPADMRVTNVADANRFIRRAYRQGWEVRGLSGYSS